VSTYLVRHAKAGHRAGWSGDDWERPLTNAGHLQAAAIADRLAGEALKSLWSSPYVRCVQTLEPLADRTGLQIATDDRLAEGARFDDTLELILGTGDGAVFCTHGDVLTDVMNALVHRGTELTTAPEWRKGAVWVLDDRTAAAEPPPDV
jgi:phosphohistidine phosphatase SixA